jgi:hypothetical protein
MTSLGTESAGVAALVYVAAFALDTGESLGALLGDGPPTPALALLILDEQGLRGCLRRTLSEYGSRTVDWSAAGTSASRGSQLKRTSV